MAAIQIDRKPMSRGVTQLMYVGDDDAVERAASSDARRNAGIAAVLALVTGQKLTTVALAAAAAYYGTKHLR